MSNMVDPERHASPIHSLHCLSRMTSPSHLASCADTHSLPFHHTFSTSSTFNLIHLLRPSSTSFTFFRLQPSSTFHAFSGLRPSTPPLRHLAHIHIGTLAGCHMVQKDEEHMLGGLKQSLASTVFVFPIPSRFWCRRTDALRSGPTSSSLLWFEPSLHVIGVGGQKLFCSWPADVSL
jgi:hypothetical protein